MRSGAAAALLAVAACAGHGTWPDPAVDPPAEPADETVDTRLLLIGDAGLPSLDGPEPVFAAAAPLAARIPDRTWVVFLGDNIYPHGLPPESNPERTVAERRLRAQIDAFVPTGARIVFVPGNHDYAYDGWAGLERQRQFVAAVANPRVMARPTGGCPGPDVIDAGQRTRLVLLDTQWWFQDGPKPRHPDSSCQCDAEGEITDALRGALAGAGDRRVVVLGHHPLVSHGGHGGHFSWRQHVFPLTDAQSWLYLPLPIVGSLYPLSRQLGITEQDLSHGTYERMRRAIAAAFAEHPPLVYAAGHEHTLQILRTTSGATYVVSGAGTVARPEPVGREGDTLFASGQAGWVRLDVRQDGSAWVEAVVVEARSPRRAFALELPRAAPAPSGS